MATAGAGLFGHVGEFNTERENFQSYVERMEMFFTANNIVETAVKRTKREINLLEKGNVQFS